MSQPCPISKYSVSDLIHSILQKDVPGFLDVAQKNADIIKADENGNTPLHYAAFIGDRTIVTYLLDNNARIDAQDKHGFTPLHRACQKDHHEVVNLLITRGCDAWRPCLLFQVPLHTCAIFNSYRSAKAILELAHEYELSFINKVDINTSTALHHALYYGHVHAAKCLLKKGAWKTAYSSDAMKRAAVYWAARCATEDSIVLLEKLRADLSQADDGITESGQSALHVAATHGNILVLEYLLQSGSIAVDCKDKEGFTPLHCAVKSGHLKVVKMLLEFGADIRTVDNRSDSLLHTAVSITKSSLIVEYLISLMHPYIMPRNAEGMTPLHVAAEYGKVSRVDALIAAGADVSRMSTSGATALHCASEPGHQLVVQRLLEAKADVNSAMKDGTTALHIAAQHAYLHVVTTLSDKGADPEQKTLEGMTALMLAAQSESQHGQFTIEALLQRKVSISNSTKTSGVTALHLAARWGNADSVDALLMAGADVDRPDAEGRNALHHAINHTGLINMDVVEKLCRSHPTCTKRKDNNGLLPVHYASYNGHTELCIYLLNEMNCGMDVPTSGQPNHITPLHIAAMFNHLDTLKAIIGYFTNIASDMNETIGRKSNAIRKMYTCTDSKRRIPLHYAMKYGNLECVKVLLPDVDCMSDLQWADNDDTTPLHLAAANGHNQCILWAVQKCDVVLNRKDNRGRTCGMLSLTNFCDSCPLILSKSKCQYLDRNGRGYLHRAVFSKNKIVLQDVLRQCSANTRDVNGVSALHVAAGMGDLIMVKMLLEAGADIYAVDKRGFFPADWAADRGQICVLELLVPPLVDTIGVLSRGSDDSAVGTGDESNISITKDSGRRKGVGGSNRRPISKAAILFAAYHGYLSCLTHIIEVMPSLISSRDSCGRTALHLAASQGHYGCVEILVENGADIEAVDGRGTTPLLRSVELPDAVNTLDYLIMKGADLSKRDDDGNTVLHRTCIYKNEEAAKFLYEHLANIGDSGELSICNLVNDLKETALHIATRNGMTDFLLDFLGAGLVADSLWMTDEQDRCPIMSAVEDPDVVKCLRLLLSKMIPNKDMDMSQNVTRERRSSTALTKSSHSTAESEYY